MEFGTTYTKEEIEETFKNLDGLAEAVTYKTIEDNVQEVNGTAMIGTDIEDAKHRNIIATPELVARMAIESLDFSIDSDSTLAEMKQAFEASRDIVRAADLDKGDMISLDDLPSDRIPDWLDTEAERVWSMRRSALLVGESNDEV